MDASNYSDVIIIGGGPAGTTAATLLKRSGWTVTLFERETHPRFHIGESLLPKNLPIIEKLGILDEVHRIGIYKPGADFQAPGQKDSITNFPFANALGDSPPHAYQVRRSEFDELLFSNCCSAGVDGRQEHLVTRVELDADGRSHRVFVNGPDQDETVWTCGYLIDASGRDTLLATQQKWKRRNPQHASAALFSHFKGAQARTGKYTGNISIYWFDHGWIWMIPLPDDTMSVGTVCNANYFRQLKSSKEDYFLESLRGCDAAWERLRDAEQIMPVTATGNYSYLARESIGNGFALIGDAYAFIDPVFSSGVYLAMSSATEIVAVADSWLRDDRTGYRKAVKRYRSRINRGISTFAWFIYRFMTPGMIKLFANSRNTFQLEQAVISMLAGDVYTNSGVRWRLILFKLIYRVTQATISPNEKHSQ
jgi:flavin-dependent dehydrogenase